jgi:hypothetical protein
MVEGLLLAVCYIHSIARIRVASRQAIIGKNIMQISPYTIKCRTLNTIDYSQVYRAGRILVDSVI